MRIRRAIFLVACLGGVALPVSARATGDSRATAEPRVIVIEPAPAANATDANATTGPAAPAHARSSERGLFWEVSGTDEKPIKSKVYLLGSVHVASASIYPMPSAIQRAFKESSVLAVEMDINPDRAQRDAEILLHTGMYTSGSDYNLRHEVSPRCWNAIQQTAKVLGIQGLVLSRMKPWFAAMTLELQEARQAGLDPKLGIDLHFLTEARKTHKEIVELEGLDEQIDMFDDMPKEQQVALACSAATEAKTFKSDVEKIFHAWKSGDAGTIAALFDQAVRETPELKPALTALLTDRNKKMTDKILGFIDSEEGETYFVVVGAGHLVGSGSIISLLQAKGYLVVQQ